MKPSSHWIGSKVHFYPIGGRLDSAWGVVSAIKCERDRLGKPVKPTRWTLEVKEFDGKVWCIYPSDVISC